MKRDKELAKKFRSKKCIVCNESYGVTGHHVISYKSNPALDVEWNMIALCFTHHRLIHDIGVLSFLARYPEVYKELSSRGFEIFNNKLIYPDK